MRKITNTAIAVYALVVAGKKAVAASPAYAAAGIVMTVPGFFTDVSAFLGPHVIASGGAIFGSAVRFHYLKMKWRSWPLEGFFSGGIGAVFGQVSVPFATPFMERVSIEMFPLANGTLIGLLCAITIGGIVDGFMAYTKKRANPQ